VEHELAGEAAAWLDARVKGLLRPLRLGDYNERVALRERPEADGRDPDLHALARRRHHRLLQVDPDRDRTQGMADVGPRAAVGEEAVAEGDQSILVRDAQ
jgi:hypothetical protein